MLNSSSTHQTVNMKLFLLSVLCLAVALATPVQKEKRDILPGDPRYGTDYHQHHHEHHENEVNQKTYGPPQHQPSPPLNNAYLSPVVDVKHTTSEPIFETPESHDHTIVQDTKQIHPPATSYGVPVTKTTVHTHTLESGLKTPTITAPVSSYGGPVITDVKTPLATAFDTGRVTYTKIQKTIVPQVDVHQTRVHEAKTIVNPEVKVVDHTFTQGSQGTFGSIAGPQHFSNYGPSVGGFSDFSNLGTSDFTKLGTVRLTPVSVPSTLYTGAHTSFGSGYNNQLLSNHQFGSLGSDLSVRQHYPVQVTKQVAYSLPVGHTLNIQKPYFIRVSQPVHEPVGIAHSTPVHQYVETKTPVLHGHVPVQKGVISDFIQNLPNFQETLSNLQLPSFQVPSLPFLKPTEAPHADAPTTLDAIRIPSVDQDSVTIENPAQTVLTETKHEYVQPTDENGGYIY